MNVCLTHDLSYKLRAREFHSIFVTFKGRIYLFQASLVAQMVKYLPTVQETQVRSLGWEDPLEKEMAIHSSTLCLENPMDRGAR